MSLEKFEVDLTLLINRHSIENEVNMPDFMLANMIRRFVEATGPCVKENLVWHGCESNQGEQA